MFESTAPIVRGYSPDNGRFVSGHGFSRPDGGITITEVTGDDVHICQVFPDTVTASTGRKDRNGTEIFIGDILKIDYMPEKQYIYDYRDGKAELISMTDYASKMKNLPDTDRTILDIEKIEDHIEVTGTIMSQLLPKLMYDWNKEGKMGNPVFQDFNDAPADIEEIDEEEIDESEETVPEQPETPEPEKKIIRGLSMDLSTWLHGKCFMHTTEDGDKSFTMFDPSTFKVGEAIPDTLGVSTGFTDKTGKMIYDGDIVLIEGKAAFVIKDRTGGIYIIESNLYHTEAAEDPANWKMCMEEVWKNSSDELEVIGDVHRDLNPDFVERYNRGDYGTVENLQLVEVSDTSTDPVRDISYALDSIIRSIKPDVQGFYYSENNSTLTETVIQCRWDLQDGNSVHAFYNMSTGESTVHYGNYCFGPDFDTNHALVFYSHDGFGMLVNYLADLLLDDRTPDKILENSVVTPASQFVRDYPMNRGWDMQRLLKDKFGDAPTISQESFRKEVRKLYRRRIRRCIDARGFDCGGTWIFGELVYTEAGGTYLRTKDEDGIWDDEHLTGTVCFNTYLLDCDGRFIYSCDVVDKGGTLYVVYMSSDIDPNNALNLTGNDSGFMYIYFMPYETMKRMIKKPEKGDFLLQWKMINPAEWIREAGNIRVVGNITDCPPLNKGAVLNSDDFTVDEDPLPLIYPKEAVMNINPISDALYFHNINAEFDRHADEFTFVAENIMGLDIEDDMTGYVSTVFHLSDQMKTPVLQIAVYNGPDSELRVLWKDHTAFTISLGHNTDRTIDLGVFRYAASYKEACKVFRTIFHSENFQGQVFYNFPFTVPTPEAADVLLAAHKAAAEREVSFANQGEYMDWLLEHGFPKREFTDAQCRAMTCFGKWIVGWLSDDFTQIYDSDNGCSFPYIRESLGFNTFIPDAAGKYIFDNDIVSFAGKGSSIAGLGLSTMMINRLSWLIYLDDVPVTIGVQSDSQKEALKNKIREPLIRIQYQALSQATAAEDRSQAQFIEADICFFLRNTERIVAVGDTITNNVETDAF